MPLPTGIMEFSAMKNCSPEVYSDFENRAPRGPKTVKAGNLGELVVCTHPHP